MLDHGKFFCGYDFGPVGIFRCDFGHVGIFYGHFGHVGKFFMVILDM